MKPEILLPGDVLLYRGRDWLGLGIEWASWVNGHEDTAYCHAALYFGLRPGKLGQWIVRQNPGGPAFELAGVQPWQNIDVRRPTIDGVVVGKSDTWEKAFKSKVLDHFGDGYAYAEIDDFLNEDLLARLGGGEQSAELRRHAALFLDAHKNVCSEFDRIVLNEAITQYLGWPGPVKFEILPGLGAGQARPADLPLSPCLPVV